MYTIYVHEYWMWSHIVDDAGNPVDGVTGIAFVSDGVPGIGMLTGDVEITRYRPLPYVPGHEGVTCYERDGDGNLITEVLRGKARLARAQYP